MTTTLAFHPAHMDFFTPGEPDRPWIDQWGARHVGEIIAQDAALTIMADGYVLGFCGVRERDGALLLWSMWSAQARAKPFAMCRALKRLLPEWREACGQRLTALDLGQEPQAKLARWLGMREASSGVWVL